ncbi:unnamed protein product, partial [Prorocentrum cordatum]
RPRRIRRSFGLAFALTSQESQESPATVRSNVRGPGRQEEDAPSRPRLSSLVVMLMRVPLRLLDSASFRLFWPTMLRRDTRSIPPVQSVSAPSPPEPPAARSRTTRSASRGGRRKPRTLHLCIFFGVSLGAFSLFPLQGTSLPDTFASMTAAVQEATADNSIGNVTGSNSVNVFLGLGMPWCIGSLYWYFTGVDILDDSDPWVVHGKKVGWWDELPEIKEEWPATFVVPAESLGMSVTIFTVCALICLALLVARRCLL